MKLTNKFITDFFSYKRPHGSDTEMQWIDKFIVPALGEQAWVDGAGNIHYDNRGNSKSATLFVSHTDTVHKDAGRQKVMVDKEQIVRVVDGECLGADDGAGALVLLSMIEANIPAYYIFTRCEERGGIGAKHLADEHAELLAQFDRAIAFDRRGTSSVITYQGWGRCCSNEFAEVLSDELSDDVLMFAPDDTGVYTDTAEFVSIIPECTNISVGYDHEHTTQESLDLKHLKALIARVREIDWEALPVARDTTITEEDTYMFANNGFTVPHYSGYSDFNSDAYAACEHALEGDLDMLLYLMAEVINPNDPDEVYMQIFGMPIFERDIYNCMKALDYATNDLDTEQALLDLYHSVERVDCYQ